MQYKWLILFFGVQGVFINSDLPAAPTPDIILPKSIKNGKAIQV
jgi:hypothetical protein